MFIYFNPFFIAGEIGGAMKMRFALKMEDLVVNGVSVEEMTLDWVDEVSMDYVLKASQQWISSQTFLTDRMIGLSKVGESSLTIEPVED